MYNLLVFEHDQIMFVRTDNGAVEGVFNTDGYIDAQQHNVAQTAQFIKVRVDVL